MGYTQIVTIATDDHHSLQEFRASVGAFWTFLSDSGRIVQKDLDIKEYTDPEHDPMIPHTLVLKPGLVVHSVYDGYWFWGRPSFYELWVDLRAASSEIAGLGPKQARAARGLGCRRLLELPRVGQACEAVDADVVRVIAAWGRLRRRGSPSGPMPRAGTNG